MARILVKMVEWGDLRFTSSYGHTNDSVNYT